MGSEETSIDVSDLELHALRRARLYPAVDGASHTALRCLAISSQYGIGVAIGPGAELISFYTRDVHALMATKDNINEEVGTLRKKHTKYFDPKASLLSIASNCDGSLIAVLANTAAGPMVHVFDVGAFSLEYNGHVSPITVVRVSADDGAKGTAMEWSPATPDTIAVAASDHTIMTVLLNLQSPANYTVIKEKKLGAVVRCISWSRKGKQLVVGDVCGKVTQMKPELDILRSTACPQSCSIKDAEVVGLSWLATTDFLVVYGSSKERNVEATIMIIKKDKPVSWTVLPDISYGSAHSVLSPLVSPVCLLDWNFVVLSSTKTCEMAVVGKKTDTWQVWCPDELYRADLPTDSQKRETFPVGADIDLSANQELILSDDGLKRGHPSPIVCVLTTDGVLLSFHTVSFNHDSPSLQVECRPINVATVRVGPKPVVVAAPQPPAANAFVTPQSSTLAGALFGSAAPAAPAATAPMMIPPAFTASFTLPLPKAPVTAQPSLFSTPTTSKKDDALAPLAGVPICTPNTRTTVATPTPVTPKAAPPNEDDERRKREAELVQQREKANADLYALQQKWKCLEDETKRMRELLNETAPVIRELEKRTLAEKEAGGKLHELEEMLKELQNSEKHLLAIVRSGILKVHDRLTTVDAAAEGEEDGGLATLRSEFDYDKDETMSRLNDQVSRTRERYAEMLKDFKQIAISKTSTNNKPAGLVKWEAREEEVFNSTVKNIRKIARTYRERLDEVEALVKRVQRLKKSDDDRAREERVLRAEKEELRVIEIVQSDVPDLRLDAENKEERRAKIEEMKRRLMNVNQQKLFPFSRARTKEEAMSGASASYSSTVSALNKTLTGASGTPARNGVLAVASPNRAALEARLLEITTPRKALQLPNLTKFAVREETIGSPLIAHPSTSAISIGSPMPTPTALGGLAGFMTPLAASTPKASAAGAAASTGLYVPSFGKPQTGAAGGGTTTTFQTAKSLVEKDTVAEKKKDEAKTDAIATAPAAEPVRKTFEPKALFPDSAADKKTAAPTPATTAEQEKPSIFGGPSKPATQPSTTTSSIFGGAASTTGGGIGDKENADATKKAEEAKKDVAAATTAAEQPPKTTSIFGGGATKPSIFGGASATTATSTPAAPSIFGGGASITPVTPTKSIFGGAGAAAATTAAAASTSPSIFGGASTTVTATSPNTTASIFGSPTAATSPNTTASICGAAPTTTTAASPNTTASIFGSPAAAASPNTTPSIFGGGAKAATPPGTSTSIFGGPAATAGSSGTTSSIFGSATTTAAAAPPPTTTSVFGGATQQQSSSAFGSAFGSSTQQPSQAAATFSFKQPAQQQPQQSAFGSFGQSKSAAGASSFAQAAAAAASMDDGMDEGGANGGGGGGGMFGSKGGFMGGLGSPAPSANANKNPFGGGGFGQSSGQTSSIFGKPATGTSSIFSKPATQTGSIFGQSSAAPTTAVFGQSKSAMQQQTSSFGQPQQSSAFGAAPAFGAKPAFGSGPAFGQKSMFGGAPAATQQTSSGFGSGGGFSAFAGQGGGASSFAAAAQQAAQSSSIFGGGAMQPAAQTSSIFGGGTTAPGANKFSSWR